MKSIRATLEIIRDITSALPGKVTIVLIGGFGVIAHGVERTTIDLDFCLYSDLLDTSSTKDFFELLKKHLPERFDLQLIESSKIPDDPFKHDLIRIIDTQKGLLRIDLLIAKMWLIWIREFATSNRKVGLENKIKSFGTLKTLNQLLQTI